MRPRLRQIVLFALSHGWLAAGSVVGRTRTRTDPSVCLKAGEIVGTSTALPNSDHVVDKFLAVPYAQPPTRFLPPEPIKWFEEEPVQATAFSKMCIQQTFGPPSPGESEDCLYLNVFVPRRDHGRTHAWDGDEPESKGLPVMFWIHGGHLMDGTGAQPLFDGSILASTQQVIVVTINYRLNIFGFSNADEITLQKNNVGFLDQRLALDWVQHNIHAFGGDRAKVTVFGESSGASSVDRLLTTLRDDPPFRAAILESGQATVSSANFGGGPPSWAAVVHAVGCGQASNPLHCVQQVDVATLRAVVNNPSPPLFFPPVNDGITQLETPLLEARARGHVARVPLLLGTNGQEGLTGAVSLGLTNFANFDMAGLVKFVILNSGNASAVPEFKALVQLIQHTDPWMDLFTAAAQIFTEIAFQCPCALVADASHQAHIPTWRYYYNATIANLEPAGFPSLGAYHSAELAIVFGTFPAAGVTKREAELSTAIQNAWGAFARHPAGGPGWAPVGNAAGSVACLGCDSPAVISSIAKAVIDVRCPLYEPLFTVIEPAY